MGGSISRFGQWRRHRQVATSVRRSSSCQHHLHPRLARVHLSHHRLQQPGGQDPRRATNSTRYVCWHQNKNVFVMNCNDGIYFLHAGTRIGQASECFVYWKDPMTSDTWGLNFTSPIDAKQFRECCVSILKHTFCELKY